MCIDCVDNFKPGHYVYTKCDDVNNETIKCDNGKCFNKTFSDYSFDFTNTSVCNQEANYTNGFVGWWSVVFPSQDYWKNVVIKESDSIENTGHFIWEIVLVLLASWIVVFFLIVKGVKGTGKVVYFTTIFPYVVLLVLGIQGWTLKGASTGIYYYIYPHIDKLKDISVWQDAAVQIFFTLSISYGKYLKTY